MMILPTLEDKVIKSANELPVKEFYGNATWSFFRYGIIGLVHVCTFADAKKVISGEKSFEEFVDEYKPSLKEYSSRFSRILIPITCLEAKGIFVPKNIYEIRHGNDSFRDGVRLFDPDYLNLVMGLQTMKKGQLAKLQRKIIETGEEEKYVAAFRLIEDNRKKFWKPEDLIVKDIAEKGFSLGKYIWAISRAEYYDYESGSLDESERIMPVRPKIKHICRRLISYYSVIMEKLEE